MKVAQETGFILHSYDYRESSLIVEVFTRNYGRLGLIAKGARRWKKKGTPICVRSRNSVSIGQEEEKLQP